MSALHTLLRIDGRPEVLRYLGEMGLPLPEGFCSRHPTLSDVRAALAQLPGWTLREPEDFRGRTWCDLFRDGLCLTTLMFESPEGAPEPVLAGTRGDPALALLRELARRTGPLVVLVNSETPIKVEAEG